MKKNKGFTLAELLVIIVIVGLLISLTGYTVTRVIKQSRENIKEQNLKSLLDSATTYVDQVVDGKETFSFPNGGFNGYKFLVNIMDNCETFNKNVCEFTSKDTVNNKYVAKVAVKLSSLKDYIDTSKYADDNKCGMFAYITITKNDKGYYVFEGVEVKASDKTEAKTCVITE